MRPIAVLMSATLVAAVLGGPAAATGTRAPTGSITVSAASSLTEAFTALGRRFERRHPKTTFTLNVGSSSALAGQIRAGAPVDVYAAADVAAMDELRAPTRLVTTPRSFARNRMEIAVKPGNPEGVTSVRDLADAGTVALCGASVPCGVYAADVLTRAGVTIPDSDVTRGADAKATIGAVAHGDADAAIVYATDVAAAGDTVDGVTIPDEHNVVALYPIATLADASNPRLAKRFVEFVVSRTGQRILARHGFLPA